MLFSKIAVATLLTVASSISSSCLAFQGTINGLVSTSPAFMRQKISLSMSNDDFFDGYDEFVSKLDFTDDGWNNQNPIGYGNDRGGGRRNNDRRGGREGRGRNRDRGGRFNDGGHDYERARDDDHSDNVDAEKVNDLIAQRLQFRKTGDFDQADDIRDHLLKEHGVTLWDKDRVWTTNRDRRGGSNRHGSNGRYGRQENGRRERGPRGPRAPRDFGPTGHDYTQVGDIDPAACTLSVSEIDALLAERLQAKMSRDFSTADGIQSHLTDQGVFVMDGFKEWRADGQEWDRSQRNDVRGGANNVVREYTQRGPCKDIPAEEVQEIEEKMKYRSQFKAERNYDEADAIKFELSDKYDITIDDKKRTWAVRSEEYLLARDSFETPDEETQAIIGKELGIRTVAKQNGDFDTADAIREDLMKKYGVIINDRFKEYAVEQRSEYEEWETANGNDYEQDIVAKVEEEEEEEEDASEEEVASEGEVNEEELQTLTVPVLKEKLRSAGLPVSGKKAELIERLLSM